MQAKLTKTSEIEKRIKENNKSFYRNIKTVKWIRRQLYRAGYGKLKQKKMLKYNYQIDKWDLATYDLINKERMLRAANNMLKVEKDQLYKEKYECEHQEKEIELEDNKSISSNNSLESLVNTMDTTINNKIDKMLEMFNNLKKELDNSKDFRRLKLNHDTSVELKKIDLINRMFPEFNDSDILISSGFLLQLENLIRNCYYSEVKDVIKIVEILSENYHSNTFFDSRRILNRITNVVAEYKRLDNSADKGQFRNYHTHYEEEQLKLQNLTQENKKIRYDLIELRREEFIKKKNEIAEKLLDGVKQQKELTAMKIDLLKQKEKLKDVINDSNYAYLKNQINSKQRQLDKYRFKMDNMKKDLVTKIDIGEKQRLFHEALNDVKYNGYKKAEVDAKKHFNERRKTMYGQSIFNMDERDLCKLDNVRVHEQTRKIRKVDKGVKMNLTKEYKEIKQKINDSSISARQFKQMIKNGEFYTLNKNSYVWNREYDKDGNCYNTDFRSHALGGTWDN